jgi:glycosyltransferase involved in cell wall biosynthesis
MTKRILLVAYHFPPVQGSSGLQRTLKFAQYLPSFGWQAAVLTAHPRAYERVTNDQVDDIPASTFVRRAFALDTARHLSIRGAYPRALALPDRWVSWWFGAVPAGLALIRRFKPDVIWSTFPIATAHLVGMTLARLTRLPWVADFRDAMTEDNYPENLTTRRAYRWIERRTVARCRAAVLTTSGSMRMYADRYPALPSNRWRLIANGYDEENFLAAQRRVPVKAKADGPLVLVHSGILYPYERDPRALLAALVRLRHKQKLPARGLRIVLRATGHDEYHRKLIAEHGVADIVAVEPAVPYVDALAEMMAAHGLIVVQASVNNHLIPAKIYEYLRAGRPILALTDPRGDTATLLRDAGLDAIAPLDDSEAIERVLGGFLAQLEDGSAPFVKPADAQRHSRKGRTAELARVLDEIVANRHDATLHTT